MIPEQYLPTILAAAATAVAIAMFVIAGCAIGASREARRMRRRAEAFLDRWEPVAESASKAVDEISEQSTELLSTLNRTSTLLHSQVEAADSAARSLFDSVQRNVNGVNAAVAAALETVSSIGATLDQTVRIPASKLRALMAGLSAGVRVLASRRARDPGRIAADEDMFI